MRVILFVTVALILCLFVTGYHAQSVETPDDMDIGQSSRGTGMTTPRPVTAPAPTTAPTRTPTTPTTPATSPTRRPMRPMRPPRMTWRDMMPGMGMGMSRDAIRMMRMESKILMRLFRALLELRMRAMMDMPRDMPLSRWQKKTIRLMALRDMILTMDIQAEETAQLAELMNEKQETPMDETESEHETEAETEMDRDTEVVPEHEQETTMMDQDFDDPTLIETEFDIAEPYGYGGYGGYGKKGGYGLGYGGGKKGFGLNFGFGKKGGFNLGFNKKAPFKKVPTKKGGYGGFY